MLVHLSSSSLSLLFTPFQVRLYLTDDDEMDLYQQFITGVCSVEVLMCVLKQILEEPIR